MAISWGSWLLIGYLACGVVMLIRHIIIAGHDGLREIGRAKGLSKLGVVLKCVAGGLVILLLKPVGFLLAAMPISHTAMRWFLSGGGNRLVHRLQKDWHEWSHGPGFLYRSKDKSSYWDSWWGH